MFRVDRLVTGAHCGREIMRLVCDQPEVDPRICSSSKSAHSLLVRLLSHVLRACLQQPRTVRRCPRATVTQDPSSEWVRLGRYINIGVPDVGAV
jgi:hypothetical protein